MGENTEKLRVARPRECNTQLSLPEHATGHATAAQLTSLKATALLVLERNRARNSCATDTEKGTQLSVKKTGAKVASVAQQPAVTAGLSATQLDHDFHNHLFDAFAKKTNCCYPRGGRYCSEGLRLKELCDKTRRDQNHDD